MKWLMVFMAVHGVSFSSDQCRVLRQVQIAPPACRSHFANQRSLAASLSGSPAAAASTPGVTGSAPGASAPGRSLSGPNHGGPPGGSSPSSPGGPTHGGPGSPGGGDVRPGQPAPPLPTLPPEKPPVSLAGVGKLRDELQQAARERVIGRIVNGAKPPPSQPGKPNFDFDGKPPSLIGGKPPSLIGGKPGLGPGGMRGEAQPRNSGSGGNGNGGSRR